MLAFALAALAFRPAPIDLDTLTVDHARTLRGKQVLVTFLVAKLPELCGACTTVGAADLPDGAGHYRHRHRHRGRPTHGPR